MDIKTVIANLLQLDIDVSLKKRMLVHSIWEITMLEGSFKGRYRSLGVLVLGVAIERDRVYQKAGIVERLLASPEQIEPTLRDVVHCVVTKEEHEQLTSYSTMKHDVDGWDRYRGAGIAVMDMLTGKQMI